MKNINELINDIHRNAVNHGWWEEERSRAEIYALIHSELSEALEEYRNRRPMIYYILEMEQGDGTISQEICTDFDNKFLSPYKPEGIAVELADVVIRILDYLGSKKEDLWHPYCGVYEMLKKCLDDRENASIARLVLSGHYYLVKAFNNRAHESLSLIIYMAQIEKWLELNKIDLEEIIKIKHEYNKTRPYKHGGKLI